MTHGGSCPRCGSGDMIPRLRVYGYDGSEAFVRIYENPRAVFAQPHRYPLDARVCSTCGYTELFVSRPQELHVLYQRAAQVDLEQAQQGVSAGIKAKQVLLVAIFGLAAVLMLAALALLGFVMVSSLFNIG